MNVPSNDSSPGDETKSVSRWEEMAQIEFENGNFPVAEKFIRSALRLGGADATNYYNLGQILYESGDYLGAIDAYGKSIPEVDEALVNRGLCWELVGDVENARTDYLAALDIDSRNVDALVNIGTLELSEKNVGLATDYLSRAAALDPRCNWQLADAYVESGELALAADALETAVATGEQRASIQLEEVRAKLRNH